MAGCSVTARVDCGHVGTTQAQCLSSGCCWSPANNEPWCFFPSNIGTCYSNFSWPSSAVAPFSNAAQTTMLGFYYQNLNVGGLGGVAASPDTAMGYFYDWMRDESIAMRGLMYLQDDPLLGMTNASLFAHFSTYTQWVLRAQADADPNGIDVRTEPKFFLPNGSVYTGGWCRPQTDGPALRATTLIEFANWLVDNGQSAFVKQYLWGARAPNGGAILYDMQWVAANWQQTGCDLWEEVQSNDFFWNRFNFRRALLDAAALGEVLGDSSNAQLFMAQAQAVNATLQNHWTGSFIMEASIRQMDAAVINAFNLGYANDDVFAAHSTEVALTIATLNELFCTTFPINQQDTRNGIPGVMYGRYAGDIYQGGNPWILTTGGLAQLLYRAALEAASGAAGGLDYAAWGLALSANPNDWTDDDDVARAMAAAGDAVLARIEYHTAGAGFHLSEQLDKYSGEEASATDLTWSYVAVLKACVARTQALAALGHW